MPANVPNFSEIYSLIAGMYPMLENETGLRTDFSGSGDYRQSTTVAPTIYNVEGDPRQPYLQGNKIIFTDSTDPADITQTQEGQLITDMGGHLTPMADRLRQRVSDITTTAQEQGVVRQQALQRRGAASGSLEEQHQGSRFVGAGHWNNPQSTVTSLGGAQKFDFYDTDNDVYVNVTKQSIRDTGHGIYGSLGTNLHTQIEAIDGMLDNGDITERQAYDQMVEVGIQYFQTRARDSWNPMIRHARDTTDIQVNRLDRIDKESGRSARSSARGAGMVRATLRDFTAEAMEGLRSNQRVGYTNFASKGAREMTLQHLGNPEAMFNQGVMETMPIAPYTFGWWGPFRMHHSQQRLFEYRASEIDGFWTQGYFATLHEGRGILMGTATGTEEAMLSQKAAISASHRGSGMVTHIGGYTCAQIGGFTSYATRLYPEVNISHANEQFSRAIHDLVGQMSDLDSTHNSPAQQELISAIESSRHQFSQIDYQSHMNGREVWAAPYVGFVRQAYTSQGL